MKTLSPEEATRLYPNQRPVITRVDDGAQYVRQVDGLYVAWFGPPWWTFGDGERFMEPNSLQHRYTEQNLQPPDFV